MGGGVMRAAGKVAGIGSVVHSGVLRGAPVPSQTGQSIRKASIPVSATLTAQSVGGTDVAPIEKPARDVVDDFEDWHVVGASDEELVMSAGEPMPRVVFDAAPSFEEAKEATTELKVALDKVYLSSPKSTEPSANVSGLSRISNTEPEELESLLITRTKVPKHALRAFEMLSRSAEAQNVVASIASDPNVWNSMMENSAVKQFMVSHNSSTVYPDEYVAELELSDPVSPKKVEHKSEGFESVFSGFVQKIKLTVDRWVNDFSTFVQNIFEPPAAESADENGNAKTVASAFMGLAVMVVMVVLMKRA